MGHQQTVYIFIKCHIIQHLISLNFAAIAQFIKIISKKIGYNINVLQQTAVV